MAAVLLRLAGADAFKANAKLDEADAERRQPGDPSRREGRPVVAAEALRQAMLGKQPDKHRPGLLLGRPGAGFKRQRKAAGHVHHRQRLAAPPVAGPEPALVIAAPHRIRTGGRCKRAAAGRPPTPPPAPDEPMPLQDLPHRRGHRPAKLRRAALKPRQHLLRTPERMRLLLRHNPGHQLGRRRTPVRQRRPRQVDKPLGPKRPIASQPLVARLARDPVSRAQRRHRLLTLQTIPNKTQTLVHDASLSPNHRRCLPGFKRTVSYVNGPFRYPSIRSGHLPGISPTRGEIGKARLPRLILPQAIASLQELEAGATVPPQSPPLWGRCPAGQRGVSTLDEVAGPAKPRIRPTLSI